jgi:hypothetical protein
MTHLIATITTPDGKPVGQPVIIAAKNFSTGSTGFHANDKLIIDPAKPEERYQLNFMLTKIGSKPKK